MTGARNETPVTRQMMNENNDPFTPEGMATYIRSAGMTASDNAVAGSIVRFVDSDNQAWNR